jgi:ribonuclease P protein component
MAQGRLGRLRKGREFDETYERGTVSSGPFFVLRVRRNGLDEVRAGYAVGKRLEPLATRRNYIRRRLREALRASDLPAGIDVIVSAKRPCVDAEYSRLARELGRELERALARLDGVRL